MMEGARINSLSLRSAVGLKQSLEARQKS
jgi:hypothetical protein